MPSVENDPTDQHSFTELLNRQFTSLSKDVLIYGVGGSLGQVITIITVPIITRILTVEEYGMLDVIYATIGYLTILMGFRITAGLFRYYYEVPENDLRDRQKMVSSITLFILSVSIPFSLLVSYYSPNLSMLLFQSEEQTLAIRLAVLTTPVIAVFNLMIGLQRLKRKPIIYLVINISNSILYFLFIFLFVWKLEFGIPGVFLAQFSSYFICTLVGIWLARDLLKWMFSRQWFFKMAAFGLPLLPASFLNWTLSSINRFALNTYSGSSQVGYYGLASKVSQVMVLVVTSFTLAWEPFMMASFHKEESRKLFQMALDYYLIITLAIGAFLTAFSKEIFLVMAPPSYLPGASLVGVLVLRQMIMGMTQIVGVGIIYRKMTIFTSISLGIGVLANLAINFWLTPRYGIYGASIADLVGYLVGGIFIYIISNRLLPIDWNRMVILKTITGYSLLTLLTIYISQTSLSPGWQILVKFCIWGCYIIFSWRLFDHNQRLFLIEIRKKIIKQVRVRLHPG